MQVIITITLNVTATNKARLHNMAELHSYIHYNSYTPHIYKLKLQTKQNACFMKVLRSMKY